MKTEASDHQDAPNFRIQQGLESLLTSAPVWIIFLLGLWFVVLKGLGPHWEFIPGDLGDGRFNNYILEHFFLWINGKVPIASSYWDAPFFYPYQGSIAFSDNLLGAAPLYALFRWVGLARETAFQSWYVCGFLLNYAAVVYVLSRARFKPLAIGVGAFFFTFGVPILSLGGHQQLGYRFCVPLACYCLLQLFNRPKLRWCAAAMFWVVWQFYLSIYLGIFLVMLLVALAFLVPFFESGLALHERFYQWPRKLKQAWLQSTMKERSFSLLIIGLTAACFFALLWPYYTVSKTYGFSRNWQTVSSMLPVSESFLIADRDIFWRSISLLFGKGMGIRHENQLFPGMALVIMVLIGLLTQLKSKNSQTARLYFGAFIVLFIATFNFNGFSFYWLIWHIPGVNSIRAAGRIQMVWMWPLAFFVAWTINGLMQQARQRFRWQLYASLFFLIGLFFAESFFYVQDYYAKADSLEHIAKIKREIPVGLPQNPILVLASSPTEPFFITEIDAMFVAQELGWPTLNGYSGNVPINYKLIVSCKNIGERIKQYTVFKHINRLAYYDDIIKRIVPVGFDTCK